MMDLGIWYMLYVGGRYFGSTPVAHFQYANSGTFVVVDGVGGKGMGPLSIFQCGNQSRSCRRFLLSLSPTRSTGRNTLERLDVVTGRNVAALS